MKTIVSSKGQIVIPAAIRRQDAVTPGQHFDIQRIARGEYLIRRDAVPNEGFIDSLLACPEKGFFVPIRSESTALL